MDWLRSRNEFSLPKVSAALVLVLGVALACKKGDEAGTAETVAVAEKPAVTAAPGVAPAASTPAAGAPAVPGAPVVPGAPAAPGVLAPPVTPDPTKPCTLLSASAAHVAKVLGTGPLAGPRAEKTKWSHRCYYYGAEAITIDVHLDAKATDLESLRKSAETAIKVPMKDHPGFGDKAFSQVIATGEGPQAASVNSLAVLKGKVLLYLASKASLEKIQALEADLLRDLGG